MEAIQDSITSSNEGFFGIFKHMFNFDEENKAHMFNMLQYTLVAIIPVFLLLKGIKNIFPEEDDTKGNLEILAESVGQIIFIMLSIWFTHKFVEYIPTYSGSPYGELNCICFIVPFLVLLTTMQTKLGAKLNILFERAVEYWQGKPAESKDANAKTGAVRVSQPGIGQPPPHHQPSQADHLDNNRLLPSGANTSIPTMNYEMNKAAQSQINSGHTQAPNANHVAGGMGMMSNEPMAANEGFMGGSTW